MYKITIIFSILIFLLLQTQLSVYAKNRNSQTMPEWVTMPSSSYPADTYFSAAGEGTDRESAELKAVQSIASLFGQNIASVSTAKMLMEKTEKDEESTSSQSKSVSQDILQNVNQDDVIGVAIKEYWFGSVHTAWYALAVLDKPKTASLYYSMIKKNNSQIESLTGKAAEKEKPLFVIDAGESGNRAVKALGKKIRSDFEQAFAGYLYNQGRHD
jgi:hypothetical protein